MTRPAITIVTPVRNAARTVGLCLESVRRQTVPAEHIVVDGVSTDGTLELIKSQITNHKSQINPNTQTANSKPEKTRPGGDGAPPLAPLAGNQEPETGNRELFRYVSEPDQGIYDAMNKGIGMASGDVVGILNADDAYANLQVLEKVAAVFEDGAVDACYGDLVYVTEAGGNHKSQYTNHKKIPNGQGPRSKPGATDSPLHAPPPSTRFARSGQAPPSTLHDTSSSINLPPGYRVVRYWRSGPYTPALFYRGWMPPHPTFFVRRSCYERLGGYRLDLATSADYELMLRFLLKEGLQVAYIPEVLVRMGGGGASNRTLGARWRANRMDKRAWEVNGLRPRPWTLLMKPLRKLPQWWRRPV